MSLLRLIHLMTLILSLASRMFPNNVSSCFLIMDVPRKGTIGILSANKPHRFCVTGSICSYSKIEGKLQWREKFGPNRREFDKSTRRLNRC